MQSCPNAARSEERIPGERGSQTAHQLQPTISQIGSGGGNVKTAGGVSPEGLSVTMCPAQWMTERNLTMTACLATQYHFHLQCRVLREHGCGGVRVKPQATQFLQVRMDWEKDPARSDPLPPHFLEVSV
ncbi:hypothetical protein SKAU_G00264960 [Synaphobranchus kaupii]|uniref:Uncharacterized protein n=1 Tax=Synaphobranchus kaupii TaxID=118154 RepID=A0A9Q1EZ49_SYNKA|nr:hypothetical protein SKAU_G00264960 [Synaphobranchus kaupii]